MHKTKFKIGQEVYYVVQEKIYVARIKSIIIRIKNEGEILHYEIEDPSGRCREVSEAYLVADFYYAKQVSLNNWENLVKDISESLKSYRKITFNEAKEIVENSKADKAKRATLLKNDK